MQRTLQPIGVLVLHVALYAFGAELAAIERKILPWLKPDDLVLAHAQLDSALLATKTTMRLHQLLVLVGVGPAAGR